MLWIVVANSNVCRIYQYIKYPTKMTLLQELEHPENKMKKSDALTSDRPGHYQTGSSARGAYSPHTDPKVVETEKFARKISLELNKGRNSSAYKNLIIITTPTMNGLLLKHIDKNVNHLIEKTIQKDIVDFPLQQLLHFIQENI